MKKIYVMFFVFVFALLSFLVAGCGDEPGDSIWDPNYDEGPTPVITSITPDGLAYAVLDEMVIKGQNFSPIKENNYLYIGTTRMTNLLTASPTEIRLMTPNLPGEDINIAIGVRGSVLKSEIKKYSILPAFIEMGGYTPAVAFYAIESDAAGNIYVNVETTGTTGRIDKIDINGNLVGEPDPSGQGVLPYATTSFGTARSMRFGPDGGLYITRVNRAIFRIPPGGGEATIYFSMPTAAETVYDIDFDNYGNMWAVMNNGVAASRRVAKLNKNQAGIDTIVASYPFNAQLRAVKVFDNYLYVAGGDGTDGNRIKIWRAAINSSGDLGAFELYFDWAANYSYVINAITFAQDGTLYVGTNESLNEETIIAISPGKVASPLYPGLMSSSTYNLIWGTGPNAQYIYVSRRVVPNGGHADNRIMKIYMAKNGAPYFGRN
jgi:hypothetical protein